MQKNRFDILSPTAILGYGFPEASFKEGLAARPDLIAVDAGSTDPGPFYLGSGKSFTDYSGVKRDLRIILKAGVEQGIPVAIGTAGGAGAQPHLEWCYNIIVEIAHEEKLSFTLGLIAADVNKETVRQAIDEQRITSLNKVPVLTCDQVDSATGIVAQIGCEPFIEAFSAGCNVVLAGRAYDPAVFAALPIRHGFDQGLALHLGKILECAAIAASPGSGADCVLGTLYHDSFVLTPLSRERVFTPESVAAHSLYEKSDPYYLSGPGGRLNLTECIFSQSTSQQQAGQVEVKNSVFEPVHPYQVKLEGVEQVGFRTITIAGSRDPVMIASIEEILITVEERTREVLKNENIAGEIFFHVYGKNGVMGQLEPVTQTKSHEIGLVIEVVAETQAKADTICSIARSTLLHYGYPGRISTAGNLAFPFSPSDISSGEVYKFSIYHLLQCDGPEVLKTLFPVRVVEIENGKSITMK